MDVEIVEPDGTEWDKLREYEGALRKRYDAEYDSIAKALRALATGEKIFDLGASIVNAPRDEKERPRLAFARADRKQCSFRWPAWRNVAQFDASSTNARTTSETLFRNVDMQERNNSGLDRVGFALVPLVPPEGLRMIGGGSHLRDHFILWEVEAWADRRIQAEADRDPYLVRHVAGELYAVVFEWDLTDLERTVMAWRRGT